MTETNIEKSSSGSWEVQHGNVNKHQEDIPSQSPQGIPPGLPKEMWVEYLFKTEELKLEHKRLELEAEVQLRRLQFEQETFTRHPIGESQFVKIPRLTANDDIDVYFKTFENLAKMYKLPKREWVARLAPELTGKARAAYASLSLAESSDYDTLKQVILAKYEVSAESYRAKFRARYKQRDESLREWVNDLGQQFDGWIEYSGRKPDDAHGIRELMVMDQALS
ncbi:hypothetical protein BSL78_13892 [Apostichopus japonicus]|uniref:Uncharacterized protein n=1 Tax=Stichopus japonicus TaxID=307972 RepID=A0A2G8KMV4_STIJA|nr:hypothetical protein BSL78_13892 [Apostichopus japonicus]